MLSFCQRSLELAGFALALVAVGSLVGCKEPVSPTPPPGLDQVVMDQVNVAGPHQLIGSVGRGLTQDEGESVSWEVPLEMGKCYAFSAAGGQTIDELKIYLFNGNGNRVLDKEQPGSKILATFCVNGQMAKVNVGFWSGSIGMATPGLYKVELKTTGGYGHLALGSFVQTSAEAAPAAAPPGAAPPAE